MNQAQICNNELSTSPSRLRRALKKGRKFASRALGFRWLLFFFILTSASPVFLQFYYSMESLRGSLRPYSPPLFSYIDSHPVLVISVSIGLMGVFTFLSLRSYRSIVSEEFLPLELNHLLYFLHSLETAVTKKKNRFSEYLGNVCSDEKLDAHAVFNVITRPDKQIQHLLDAFYIYIYIVSKGANLKVYLYFVEDGRMQANPVYYTSQCDYPRTPLELLSKENAPISRAIQTENPVLVPDIRVPTSEGVVFQRRDNDERYGALLTFPIVVPHLNEVKMVLCILEEVPTADSKPFISRPNMAGIKYAEKWFAERLVIEYCLQTLKNMTLGDDDDPQKRTA